MSLQGHSPLPLQEHGSWGGSWGLEQCKYCFYHHDEQEGVGLCRSRSWVDDPCGLLPAQGILWFCGDSKSQTALRQHVQPMQTLMCVVLICHWSYQIRKMTWHNKKAKNCFLFILYSPITVKSEMWLLAIFFTHTTHKWVIYIQLPSHSLVQNFLRILDFKYQHQVCLVYNMTPFIIGNNKQHVCLRFVISSSHKQNQDVCWLFVWLSFHFITGDQDRHSALTMWF